MRKLILSATAVMILSLAAVPRVAAAPVGVLSDAQLQQVRQTCREAQVNLHSLQQRDTVLRINRGRLYDQVSKQTGAFVARLGVNKVNAPEVKQIDSDIRNQVQYFKSDYNSYANDLDAALAANCTDKPQDFYDSLQRAVSGRRAVGADVDTIKQGMASYVAALARLQNEKFPAPAAGAK
jgi:hypothetical protein